MRLMQTTMCKMSMPGWLLRRLRNTMLLSGRFYNESGDEQIDNNYYIESIEKNIAYLAKVIASDEAGYLSMLKRGGIVEESQNITVPN